MPKAKKKTSKKKTVARKAPSKRPAAARSAGRQKRPAKKTAAKKSAAKKSAAKKTAAKKTAAKKTAAKKTVAKKTAADRTAANRTAANTTAANTTAANTTAANTTAANRTAANRTAANKAAANTTAANRTATNRTAANTPAAGNKDNGTAATGTAAETNSLRGAADRRPETSVVGTTAKHASETARADKSNGAQSGSEKTVDDYVSGLRGWQQMVAQMLRQSVRRAAPDAKESIKWAQPVYEDNGPFAYFKAFGNTLNFGFWRGAEMADPHKLLRGDGDRMRHVTMHSPQDVQPQYLEELIREAVVLNRTKGDPTKRSS